MSEKLININQNKNGSLIVGTKEIADNFGKKHKDLIKKIEGSKDRNGLIQGLIDSATNVAQYFIESEYKDNSGKMNKQYLLTRDGFSLLVMGFTGKKALNWKLKYIDAFNKMEEHIKNSLNQPSYLIDDPIERAKAWIEEQEEKKKLVGKVEELSPLAEMARKRIDTNGTVSITDVTKTYNLKRGQITTFSKIKGYIHKTIQEVNKAGEKFFKVVDYNGHKGIGILEEGIKMIDKNINQIKKSETSYKRFVAKNS